MESVVMTNSMRAFLYVVVWWVAIILLLASYRVYLTQTGKKVANQFAPDGSDLGPFGQRLTRVHANNFENLPMYTAILGFAVASGRHEVTDGLALYLSSARMGQGIVHLISTAVPMVLARFALYAAQIAIVLYWIVAFWG